VVHQQVPHSLDVVRDRRPTDVARWAAPGIRRALKEVRAMAHERPGARPANADADGVDQFTHRRVLGIDPQFQESRYVVQPLSGRTGAQKPGPALDEENTVAYDAVPAEERISEWIGVVRKFREKRGKPPQIDDRVINSAIKPGFVPLFEEIREREKIHRNERL
jgi:hypothetical protein